jgi:hypothetical protein
MRVSPRLVCALEKFKDKNGKPECQKGFRQNRPWQRCCSDKHTKRLAYLEERRERAVARRRKEARKRAQEPSNAPREHSRRFSRTRPGNSRDFKNVLGALAAARPEFFLRLASATSGGGKSLQEAAPEPLHMVATKR